MAEIVLFLVDMIAQINALDVRLKVGNDNI